MEGEHAPGLYEIDVANQIVVVSVIRKRKSRVNLVAIDRVRIDCPATNHRDTFARNTFQHARSICSRWADENFFSDIICVDANVFAKKLVVLLVYTLHMIDRIM